MIVGSLIGSIFPLAMIALIVFAIRKLKSRTEGSPIQGHSVRRFFQYLLLYILLVISAIGLSGLLGNAFDRSTVITSDPTGLARNLSFVVVGIPLYIILALWTRSRFSADKSEIRAFGWSAYFTLASITSLIVAMIALHDMLAWSFNIYDFRGGALAKLLVWGGIWIGHWAIQVRVAPAEDRKVHYLLGSLVGLTTLAMGCEQLISAAIGRIWNFGGEALFLSRGNPILKGVAIFAVGLPVWFLYWVKNYSKKTNDVFWLIYVLLAGIAGGLIMAIVSASAVLYRALVWLIGDPGFTSAAVHFQNFPTTTAAAITGIIIWWYHHSVLDKDPKDLRTEVTRVYEYLMAGIGLLAAAGGLAMVLVAVVEAITRSSVISGSSAINALLAALTLLGVGGPVWAIYWHRIQLAVSLDPQMERGSPTRRVYLYILFGVGGIVAVITLLIGVFLIFDDIIKGNFGMQTIGRIRFALAILISTGAISGYHWLIYKSERSDIGNKFRGPHYVLLIGPKDPDLLQEISRLTGGQVHSWIQLEAPSSPWSHEKVLELVGSSQAEEVIILSEVSGLRLIPIERG